MSKLLSNRWSAETKTLVNDSKLNLLRVYDNTYVDTDTVDILKLHKLDETYHCDFCGQRIKYVSVLEFDKNTVISHFQIGKECMSYLFDYDMRINGLDQAKYQIENAVKKLIKKSSERARAEKYKTELSKYIDWLKTLDSAFIQRNSFLRFISERINTGNGVVTMKMMNVLDNMIVKYNQKNTAGTETKRVELLKKIDSLLIKIQSLYGAKGWSYDFTSSVREYVNKKGIASVKQLEVLNKIHKEITEKIELNAKKELERLFDENKKEKKQEEFIPW